VFELIRRKLPAERQAEYRGYLAEFFDFRGNVQKNEEALAALYRRFGLFYMAAAPAMRLPSGAAGMAGNGGLMPLAVYLSMGRKHDYRAAFRAVTVPVLVIHGRDDLQPAAWSRSFAELFPNHRLVEIDGAGHFVFDDQPGQFTTAVEEFLGAL
jgi:proline iminopeptidase